MLRQGSEPWFGRRSAEVSAGGTQGQVTCKKACLGGDIACHWARGGVPGQAAVLGSSAGVWRRSTFGGSSTSTAANTALMSGLGVVVC